MNNQKFVFTSKSNTKLIVYLSMVGVLFAAIPQILGAILQTSSRFSSFTPTDPRVSLVMSATNFVLNVSFFAYILSKMFSTLSYPTFPQKIQGYNRFRRLFQYFYIPYSIVTVVLSQILSVLFFPETIGNSTLGDILISAITYPVLLICPSYIVLEYLLDKIFIQRFYELGIAESRTIPFTTLSSGMKYVIISCTSILGVVLFMWSILDYSRYDSFQFFVIAIFSIYPLSSIIIQYFVLNTRLSTVITEMERLSTENLMSKSGEILLTSIDDIGNLVVFYNRIVLSLQGLADRISQMTNEVASVSEEQATISGEVSELSDEISATIQQISQGSAQMSQHSTDAIDDLHTMSKSVNDAMKDIESTTLIIKHIAKQTNILSLNAAIEAARAGEYGRGFAVVADNVRRLAEETRGHSSDIESKTNLIQENIRQNIDQLHETLQNFAAQAEEFSASSEQTAAGTEEQNAALFQLTSTAQDLAKSSQNLLQLITKDVS